MVRGFVLGREGEEAKQFVEFLVLCGKPRTLNLGEREREREREREKQRETELENSRIFVSPAGSVLMVEEKEGP
jgi:hypothetical protein